MIERLIESIAQLFLLLALAPLVTGGIRTLKALLQMRRGPGILQPYRDLNKLFRKGMVIPETASWIFATTPWVLFFSTVLAGLMIPMVAADAPLGLFGGVLAVIYLLGLGLFFLALSGTGIRRAHSKVLAAAGSWADGQEVPAATSVMSSSLPSRSWAGCSWAPRGTQQPAVMEGGVAVASLQRRLQRLAVPGGDNRDGCDSHEATTNLDKGQGLTEDDHRGHRRDDRVARPDDRRDPGVDVPVRPVHQEMGASRHDRQQGDPEPVSRFHTTQVLR